MANITTAGTSDYPSSLDTRTVLTDGASGDEIIAAHPNGLSAAVINIEGELGTNPSGSLGTVDARLDVALNEDGTVKSTVVAAGNGASVSYSSGVFTVSSTPDGPGGLQNIAFTAVANSPAANQLTFRLTDADLSTPTTSVGPAVTFRNTNIATADYVVITATQNTSLTLSNGSTLGFVGTEIGRIYLWAISTLSTIALGVSRKASFNEGLLVTTTAEGGLGTADSDAIMYSIATHSNAAVRCLGYVDVQSAATAGNWDTAPIRAVLMGPGVLRTGDIVQRISTNTSGVKTGTAVTPADNSEPDGANEGLLALWSTITATSPANPLQFDVMAFMASSGISSASVYVGTQTSGGVCGISGVSCRADNVQGPASLHFSTITGFTTARGYYLYVGNSGASTITLNGEAAAARWGDATPTKPVHTEFTITEVMA